MEASTHKNMNHANGKRTNIPQHTYIDDDQILY